MAPNSPGTEQIDTLMSIGFVAAAILIVAVNVALFYALRRYRGERGDEPRQVSGGRRIQFRAGAALTLFAAVAAGARHRLHRQGARDPGQRAGGPPGRRFPEPLQIEATGQQWLWRYDYPNESFSYYKLVVPVDTDRRTRPGLHRRRPHLVRPGPGRQARRGARQAQPGRLPRRRGRHLRGRLGNALRARPTRRCGPRSKSSPRSSTKPSSTSQKADIQAAQDRVVGLIDAGETP